MVKIKIEDSSSAQPLSGIEKLVFGIVVGLVFLLPIFFIPSAYTTFDFSKGILISAGAVLVVCLWIIARLKDNKLIFSKSLLLIAPLVLVIVYLISALASASPIVSLVGNGFEFGTFGSIFSLAVLMCIVAYISRSNARIFSIYGAVFVSFIILAVFHITRFFVGADFLSFGYFTDITYNTIGKWNDMALFFGLVSILLLLTLELLKIKKGLKILLSILLFVALAILAVVNFQFVWILIGTFSLIFFVYALAFGIGGKTPKDQGPDSVPKMITSRKLPVVSFIVLIISLVFILGGQAISNPISQALKISQLDVRPSWSATFQVAKDSLKQNPIFGVGPNRFVNAWLEHKPDQINQTQFWGVDFNYGIGFIPTAIVTTGLVGTLAWLFLLISFLAVGYQALSKPPVDTFRRYLTISSFLSAFYLWVVLISYVPSLAMLALAFIFTGLFIASAWLEGSIKLQSVSFSDSPKISFIYVLVLVLLFLGTLALGYVFVQKFISSIYFQKSSIELNVGKNVDNAEIALRKASLLSTNDAYARSLSEIDLVRLGQLANSKGLSQDQLRSEFTKIVNIAETDATSAVKIDSTNYQNWLSLGRVYESVMPLNVPSSYENAKAVYLEAIKRNPKNPLLYLLLARLEAFKGNIAEARLNIEKALAIKSDYQDAINLLSELKAKSPGVSAPTPTVKKK